MEHDHVEMGFTKTTFPAGTHMCLIFSDEQERKKIMSQFVGTGLLSGENVAYYADEMTKEEVLKWLANMDIDTGSANATHNLLVQDTLSAYCPDGKFEVEGMLDRLRVFYNQAIEKGYSYVRASGEMSWALKGVPGSENLMIYEAMLNDVFRTYPITGICQFDANLFDGGSIADALKVHPMMIVKGQIVHNPYYMSPSDFINEFNARNRQGE